jgi:hypothetical protein
MRTIFFICLNLVVFASLAQTVSSPVEKELLRLCGTKDISACEKLAAFYVKNENWDNALLVGEALCSKDIKIGCTMAGMSLLSKKKSHEGVRLLNSTCDKFEPYACRSLGRLMKDAGKKDLSHLYFRRSCYFGLNEVCKDLQKGKKLLSSIAQDLIKRFPEDCSDTKSLNCQEKLDLVNKCTSPLSKEDCELLPGVLSIFFRAKMIQAEARVHLNNILMAERKLKQDPKINSFSFDLENVLSKNTPSPLYYYVFGFMKACSGSKKATSLELYPEAYAHLSQEVKSQIKSEFSRYKSKDCYDSKWGLEAYAIGSLDPLKPSKLDIWKINHDGNLMHLRQGLPVEF